MREFLTKKLPMLVAAAFVATSGFCAQNGQSNNSKLYDQGHAVQENQMLGAYNAPARIDVRNCWDFFITGTFLWMSESQKGMEIGRYVSSNATLYRASILNMGTEYDPAFRVGLGWNTTMDDWQIYVEYTRMHLNVSKHSVIPVNMSSLTPFWLHTYGTVGNTSAKWSPKVDFIDLEFARPCYVGTKLTFRPHIGARGGWIDQKFNINYKHAGTNVMSKNKSDSWLIGPRAGLDTNWIFGGGFRMFGNLATSLFYQKFTTKTKQELYTNPNALNQNYKDKLGTINPYVEIATGLGWGTYFDNSNWHIDLSVAYEFHHFWDQNMMRVLIDSINNRIGQNPGNLAFQGLSATLRLDF